jgi:hypothetical protein
MSTAVHRSPNKRWRSNFNPWNFPNNMLALANYNETSGFWPRVRASLSGLKNTPNGRCAPPIAASLLTIKKKIPETKGFPSGPNSDRQGHISFHWAKLHPTELHCTYWATMHPPELPGTLMSYAAPYWATLHPTKLCCIQLSNAAYYLSYAAPYLSYTLHPLS